MTNWGAIKAKAQFSAVLDKAETEGPQIVQRRKREFVLLTKEEFTREKFTRRTAHSGASAEGRSSGRTTGQDPRDALRPAPEGRVDFEVPRLKWQPRNVKF